MVCCGSIERTSRDYARERPAREASALRGRCEGGEVARLRRCDEYERATSERESAATEASSIRGTEIARARENSVERSDRSSRQRHARSTRKPREARESEGRKGGVEDKAGSAQEER